MLDEKSSLNVKQVPNITFKVIYRSINMYIFIVKYKSVKLYDK